MNRTLLRLLPAVVTFAALAGCGAGTPADTRAPAAPELPEAPQPPEASRTPRARPAAARMDQAAFWGLIADTRAQAGNDTARQSQLLEQRLEQLPARSIADFQRIRHAMDVQAYTWELWGAAYVIEDGCSDDCFRDFRGYLISLGPKPFESALRDPDSLAPFVQDAEQGDWENADSVAGEAYQSVAGEDIPAGDSDLSGSPRGEQWDDGDEDALVRRYPRLAARFR